MSSRFDMQFADVLTVAMCLHGMWGFILVHHACVLVADASASLQEILEIEQLMDEDQGLELTEGNIETVLDEIRPYLVGELGCHPATCCILL